MRDYKELTKVDQLRIEHPNLDNYILSLTDIIAKLEVNNIDLTNNVTKLEKEKADLVKRHIELENSLIELRKYHKEFEQFATTVYDPKKSTYKELETKVAQAETKRQKDIDELWETRITPLQNQVKDREIKMESMYKQQVSYTEEISHLKKVIENLGMLINYAVGYISACEQFRDKRPNDVKNWLFEGLK